MALDLSLLLVPLKFFDTLNNVEKIKNIAPINKNDLTTYYQYALTTSEGQAGYKYFIDRGINDELQKTFKLGYAFNDGKATINYLVNKGHSLKSCELIGVATGTSTIYSDKNAGRIIFPLCDANGQVVGYSARRIKEDGTAKYINSPETKLFHKSSVLYNYHIAKEEANGILPQDARPAATLIILPSAIPAFIKRSGYFFLNTSVLVDFERSASKTTTRSSAPQSIKASP